MPLLGLDPLLLLPASYITPLVALDKGALEGNEEKDWALSTAMMLTTLVVYVCTVMRLTS